MFERVDHIEVYAKDLDETVGFYTGILGFTPTRRTVARRPDGSEFHQACVMLGDFMLELIQAPQDVGEWDPARLGVKTFALRVADMAAAKQWLTDRGVVFSREPAPGSSFQGLRAEILDPNGLSIELREWQGGDHPRNAAWRPSNEAVTLLS